LLDMIDRMLQFNPNNRITVNEALANSYFDDIREPEKEINADIPADFEFEYIENITAHQLRSLFVEEIMKYQ